MTEEFNLSEKMFDDGEFSGDDVKEAVRLLKEKVENNNSLIMSKTWISELDILDWINKIFGDKLT